jgi:muconate cycloisomerase
MQLITTPITLKKRYPLRISRGLMSENHNLWVTVVDGAYRGYGEMAAGGGIYSVTPEAGAAELANFAPCLHEITRSGDTLNIFELWEAGNRILSPAVLAALDCALWDLHGKRAGMPLWRLLGLSRTLPPTSVTIGINPPELQQERVPEILHRTAATILKIKLGSPDGIEADKEAFSAIAESLPSHQLYTLRVDANGGWSLADAESMMRWLAERSVQFVEQPLAIEQNDALPHLFKNRALPILVDESCQTSRDLPALANSIDGVVVKLMKAGGITEALRIVATARAHRLKTMIGCMGESSIAISAGAAIGSLFDWIDLDSHLNLLPDPAHGVDYEAGYLKLTVNNGHGAAPVELKEVF